jgi:hypothetical protein
VNDDHARPVPEMRYPDASVDRCPVCDSAVQREERRTSIYLGPADIASGRYVRYAITTPGPAIAIHIRYRCAADEEHYWGPVLLG